MSPLDPPVPKTGEEIHLPRSSLLPLLLAVGITFALVGLTVSKIFLVGGLLIAIPVLFLWIRGARAEFDELPPGPH